MSELGTLGRRQAASLLGLAPSDRDTRRHMGGRTRPRRVLYMAAHSVVRWELGSQVRSRHLTVRGKPHNVAMMAVMRRLACPLNTLLREDRLWQAEAPCPVLQTAA